MELLNNPETPLEVRQRVNYELIPGAKLTVFEESNHNPFSEEEGKFIEFVKETL